MKISIPMKTELNWWIHNIQSAVRKISHGSPDFLVVTDASPSGWGAVCENKRVGGRWSSAEEVNHINFLELLAIQLALKTFCRNKQNLHVLVRTDNTTAMSYINKMGGMKSSLCNDLAKEIWIWASSKQIWLTAGHIPCGSNIADYSSRNFNDNVEWMLDIDIVQKIFNIWNTPDIDMFASRLNKQLVRFVSWKPDPFAEMIDAFSVDWNNLYFYAFPPFSLISRVLRKLREDNGECVIVAPLWTTQTWYPTLMEMIIDSPYIIPKHVLSLPGTTKTQNLDNKLVLMACRLSGNSYRSEKYRAQFIMASWRPNNQKQYNMYIKKWFLFCDKRKKRGP